MYFLKIHNVYIMYFLKIFLKYIAVTKVFKGKAVGYRAFPLPSCFVRFELHQ